MRGLAEAAPAARAAQRSVPPGAEAEAAAARGPPGTAVPGTAISPSGSAGAPAAVTLSMESGFGSDFGSGGGGGGKLDPGLIMEQVKVQIAVANAQELLQVRRGGGAGRVRIAGDRQAALLPSQRRRRLRPEPPGRGPAHGLSPQRMTDKCFRKCIGKPGGALDNSEQVRTGGRSGDPRPPTSGLLLRLCVPQKCIAMCMDRYMDSWNTVSRAYNSRLQRERANM